MQRWMCAVVSVLLLMQGCTDSESGKPISSKDVGLTGNNIVAVPDTIATHLSDTAFAQLSKTVEATQALGSSIRALSRQPSNALLEEARGHWRSAYSAYLESLPAINIPIEEPTEWTSASLTHQHLKKRINSWPIEPGYIDYLEGYPITGIVNDTTLTINTDTLINQHQFSDPTYVSLGFHALEFLLWGEYGKRQASDFDTNLESNIASERDDHNQGTIYNQARRLTYLTTTNDILIADLQRLKMRWTPPTESQTVGYYAQRLSEMTPVDTLQASLLTIVRLIERDLLQQYLQNEGSSPFSATASEDLAAILRGINRTLLTENGLSALQPVSSAHTNDVGHTLLSRLISLTSEDTSCSAGWTTTPVYTDGQRACREQMLDLLITLKKISDQLGLQIPVSG